MESEGDLLRRRQQLYKRMQEENQPDGNHRIPKCGQDGKKLISNIAAIGLPVIVTLIYMFVAFEEFITDDPNPLQIGLWILFFALLFANAIGGVYLLETTNARSISEMVAQRHNKISYMLLLSMAGMAFVLSTLILCSGLIRILKTGKRDHIWQSLIGALSPILSFLILVFPLTVKKTACQLAMIPLGDDAKLTYLIPFSNELEIFNSESMQTQYNVYTVSFLPCGASEKTHIIFHYLFIGSGLITGWIYIYSSFPFLTEGIVLSTAQTLIGLSIGFVLLFLILGKVTRHPVGAAFCSSALQGVVLSWLEFLALYFYVVGLAYIASCIGGILTDNI